MKKMPSETNILGASWSLLRGEIVTHWILIQIVHKFSLKLSALQVNSSNNNARGINFDSAIKEYYIANTRRCIGRLNHNSVIKQVEDGMIKLIPLHTMQKCAVINFTSDNQPSVTKRSTFILHSSDEKYMSI